MQETWVGFLGWEDPLEKGMATYSSILAWRIPWTVEPGRLQSMVSQRFRHDLTTKPPPGLSCSMRDLQSSLRHVAFSRCMRTLSHSMWDLVPWLGIEPESPALGAWDLSHWTTREVPEPFILILTPTLWKRYHFYLLFTDKETKI